MKKLSKIVFPEFSKVHAYMLPIKLGDHSSIPESFRGYIPIIDACNLPSRLNGEIAYLTVKEDFLKTGETQVSPQIHLDLLGLGFNIPTQKKRDPSYGIYLANTIENSCQVWNKKINPREEKTSYSETELNRKLIKWMFPKFTFGLFRIGLNLDQKDLHSGEINHKAKALLGRKTLLSANTLYHLHEFNPHQAIPQKKKVHRQLFRLTVGPIYIWDKSVSTPNPNIELDPNIVQDSTPQSSDSGSGSFSFW